MRAVCGLDVRGLQISPSLFAYLLENLYISSKKAISLRADILINRGGGSFETHTPACPNGYSKWSIRFNNVIISSSSFKTQTGVLRRLKR